MGLPGVGQYFEAAVPPIVQPIIPPLGNNSPKWSASLFVGDPTSNGGWNPLNLGNAASGATTTNVTPVLTPVNTVNQPFLGVGGGYLEEGLNRGYLETFDTGAGSVDRINARLNFMYNPSEIRFSYMGANTPTVDAGPDDDSVQMYRDAAGVSWSLKFDRMLEHSTGKMPDGVVHDIRVWEAIVGVWEAGNLTSRPARVVFGPKLKFVGYVDTATVRYEMFTPEMVPIRAEIDFSLKIMFRSNDPSSRRGGGGWDPFDVSGAGGGGGDDTRYVTPDVPFDQVDADQIAAYINGSGGPNTSSSNADDDYSSIPGNPVNRVRNYG